MTITVTVSVSVARPAPGETDGTISVLVTAVDGSAGGDGVPRDRPRPVWSVATRRQRVIPRAPGRGPPTRCVPMIDSLDEGVGVGVG